MSDLIEKLEGATEGSRELTMRVAEACGFEVEWTGREMLFSYSDDDSAPWGLVPDYTTSLDAALALVDRKLPNSDWTVSNESPFDGPGPVAWVQPEVGRSVQARAKTAPLALCIALLRALLSQEEGR